MITVLVTAKKLPHLSQAEFTRYWLDEHAPLVKSVPEFMQYVKRYVIYPNLQDSGPDAPVLGQVPEHHGNWRIAFQECRGHGSGLPGAKIFGADQARRGQVFGQGKLRHIHH